MRRFLFWSLCFCLLFPVGLSSCDGSDSAAVIFGGTTGKLTWTLTEDGVLTITGEGPMPDYRDGGTSETPPWYPHVNRISSLTIGEGVTRIGDYAFMLCSFVTKVVIPESVTSMGDWAFLLLYGFAGGLYRRWSYRDCRESVCGMHRIENGRYRKEYSAYRRSGLQYEEFLGSDDPGEDYRFVRRYCVRLFPGVGERFERRLPETRRLGSGFLQNICTERDESRISEELVGL